MSNILNDLITHLVSKDVLPEGSTFMFAEPAFEEVPSLTENVIFSLNVSSGASNPKWARDTWFINFRSRGRSKQYIAEAEAGIKAIHTELLGSPSIKIGNAVYSQFIASESPRFSGFYEGSEPIFQCTFIVVEESLVDVGNRQTY